MIGHPKRFTEGFGLLETVHERFKGLIKCKILPPDHMFLPLLHIKVKKKLVFPLCQKCAIEMTTDNCAHEDSERSLVGTYTHVEIQKAIQLGYRIQKVYAIWHWDEWSNSIFKPYVQKFFKVKVEASGWPDWCRTEKQKDLHIRTIHERDGVLLDKSKVQNNPGKRKVS